jgi:hypothetical protein
VQTPEQAVPRQTYGQDVVVCHEPAALQVSTDLPLHRVVVGVHVPPQTPPLHEKAHVWVVAQAPAEEQVWTFEPEH